MADPQVEQARARANSLVVEGRLDEGAALYQQLIAQEPHNLELYRDLALLYERKGDLYNAINTHLAWAGACAQLGLSDDALNLYQQVLSFESNVPAPEKKGLFKSGPSSADTIRDLVASSRPAICVLIGQIYIQKKMPDEAIKYLKGALDSAARTGDHWVHTLLGIAYMQRGDMDKEAIGEFQEVVRLAPDEAALAYEKLGEIYRRTRPSASTVWFRNAGDLYLRKGEYQEAVGAYAQILETEPRNKDVLNRLAEIYTQLEMRDEALATWRALAAIYTDEGLLDKVITLYEKLLELNPHDEDSWARLLDIYRGILQRDPSNLSVRVKMIRHLLARGDQEAALPEYIALAQAYLEKGVVDEAEQILGRLLDLDPSNARAIELCGDLHHRRGEKDEAVRRYVEAVKAYGDAGDEEKRLALSQKLTDLFGQESGVQYEIARSLKDQGSFAEALAEIMKVLEQDPQHVRALTEASELLTQMGRHEEARPLYERLLELDPSRTDVRLRLFENALATHQVEAARAQLDTIAQSLRARGELDEAEAVYRRMLVYHPDDAEVRQQICAILSEKGEVDAALREYLLLASVFLRRQSLERACEMYAAILAQRPDHMAARRSLGRTLALQGRTGEALENFALLVRTYLERNLGEQALTALRESVDIAPSDLELRQGLADLQVRMERHEEAAEQLVYLHRAHLDAGHPAEAAACARACIDLQPHNLEMRLELASTCLAFDQTEAGQSMLDEVVSAALERRETRRVIEAYDRLAQFHRTQGRLALYWQMRERAAELYLAEGRRAEALGEMHEIVEAALREGAASQARAKFVALCDLYTSEARLDDGIRAVERLAEALMHESPGEAAEAAHDLLLMLLEQKGESDRARDLLGQMAQRAEASGDVPLGRRLRGRMYALLAGAGDHAGAAAVQFQRIAQALSQREIDAAMSLFVELRALRPESLEDVSRQAILLFEHGFHNEALPLLDEAATADPQDAEAGGRLALASARAGDVRRAARTARRYVATGLLDRVAGEVSRADELSDGERALRLGDFYHELGFHEEAVSHFLRAAAVSELQLGALHRIASLFQSAGHVDLALRQLLMALDLPGYEDEDLLETRYNLALLCHESGRLQDALVHFNECAVVRLRYRDVAERVQELTAILASGTHPQVAVPAVPGDEGALSRPPAETLADLRAADVAAQIAAAEAASAVPTADLDPLALAAALEPAPAPVATEAALEPAPAPESVVPAATSLEPEPASVNAVASSPEPEPVAVIELAPTWSPPPAEEPAPVQPTAPASPPSDPSATTSAVVGLPEAGDDDFFLEGPPPDTTTGRG